MCPTENDLLFVGEISNHKQGIMCDSRSSLCLALIPFLTRAVR